MKIADSDFNAFIRRADLSRRERSEQRPERFNVGDKIDAAVTNDRQECQSQDEPVDQGA